MATDRFTRFKVMRALWARAKTLLGWLHGPRAQHDRARLHYWQYVNVAHRQVYDGLIRGPGDPDNVMRPLISGDRDTGGRPQPQAAHPHRLAYEWAQWQAQQRQQHGGRGPHHRPQP